MKAEGIVPELPPNPAPYLTDWLFEIGPTVPGGMSPAPIGWQDMLAWQTLTGIEMLPWEAQVVRSLSGDFLVETQNAKKIDCPAPWAAGRDQSLNREAISRQVGIAFRAFAAAQKTKRSKPRSA